MITQADGTIIAGITILLVLSLSTTVLCFVAIWRLKELSRSLWMLYQIVRANAYVPREAVPYWYEQELSTGVFGSYPPTRGTNDSK